MMHILQVKLDKVAELISYYLDNHEDNIYNIILLLLWYDIIKNLSRSHS